MFNCFFVCLLTGWFVFSFVCLLIFVSLFCLYVLFVRWLVG